MPFYPSGRGPEDRSGIYIQSYGVRISKKVLYLQSVISILAPVGAIHFCLHSWQPTGPWQCRSYMGIPPRVTHIHCTFEQGAAEGAAVREGPKRNASEGCDPVQLGGCEKIVGSLKSHPFSYKPRPATFLSRTLTE